MARQYKRQLGSRNYRNYTEESLQKAVEEVRNKTLSLRKAQKKYGIHYNTLWTRLKGTHSNVVGRPQALSADEERCIAAHLISMSSFGFPMTTFDVRLLVRSYLNRCGKVATAFKDNLPGKDWASAFLLRHKKYLSQRMARNISHNRAATNEEILREFFAHFRSESEGVPQENIWNYDETNLVDLVQSLIPINQKDKSCQAEKVVTSNMIDNSLDLPNTKTNFTIGDYVVVNYNDDLYPGQITGINSGKINVSSMAKKGAQWIWPARKDELDYDFEDVLFTIKKPSQISRREIYVVPELEKMLF